MTDLDGCLKQTETVENEMVGMRKHQMMETACIQNQTAEVEKEVHEVTKKKVFHSPVGRNLLCVLVDHIGNNCH